MPPRAESSPSEAHLSAEQRVSIVEGIVHIAKAEIVKMVMDPAWTAEKPYIPLLATTGYLTGSQDLLPNEQRHIKRMMVLEAAEIDHRKWRAASHALLMEEIARLVTEELAEFQTFSGDRRRQRGGWREASADRLKIYKALPELS